MTSHSHDSLQSRLDFIGLDDAARARLAESQSSIRKHLEPALDLFYDKIGTVPAVKKFFDGRPQMDRAKSRQMDHWNAIASGQLDQTYFEASTRVGLRHAQIGLEPRWHIGGYGLIMETLVMCVIHDLMDEALTPVRRGFGRQAIDHDAAMDKADAMAAALVAVFKSILLDIDIGVTAYFDKLSQDAREAEAAARARIEKAVQATGVVLRQMAQGDLTGRVEDDLDPEFEAIKTDTNGVAEKMAGIVGQLKGTARTLRTATGEILSGANDLSERTTKQAATIEQTAASIEQLSSAVVENARRAATASDKAQSLARNATDGGAAMTDANTAMVAIEASSAKISNIIGLIDDIAFQTNLLALNASVEAARAGDAGKGFAVVAVEVRRLAQSAANASSEVKALIETSASEVRNGSQRVARAAEMLLDILAGAEESAQLIDRIAQENQSQSQALEEVSVAVRQMDEMTQHNAALVEQINASIEQTETQAVALDDIVDVFRIDGHSEPRQSVSAVRPARMAS